MSSASGWHRATALALGSLLAGCGHAVVHQAFAASPDELDARVSGASTSDIEAQLRRSVSPATNMQVHATLWETALVLASHDALVDYEAIDAAARADDDRRDVHARLKERYLEGQTAVTVVMEFANRPRLPDGEHRDAIVDPTLWRFELSGADGAPIPSKRVTVQAVDRFPTRAGGYHWRAAYTVHFPKELTALAEPGPRPTEVSLHVRRTTPDRLLGPWLHRRGFRVRWWVTPSRPAASTGQSAPESASGSDVATIP